MTVTVLYGCDLCGYRHRISSSKATERKVLLSAMGGAWNRAEASKAHAVAHPDCAQRMLKWKCTTMAAA